jgi:uncharacterized membrane protein YjfL (UPF0719 family)
MVYSFTITKCSNCKKRLFIKILKILFFIRATSGLGPNVLICSSCGAQMKTAYKEWQQMSGGEKLWYALLSLLYGVVIGYTTSILFERALSTSQAWLVVGVPMALITVFIQMIRIKRSNERMENQQESKKTVSFWDWETNLQFYGMAWMILILLIYFVLPFPIK